jgi:bifunctional UDP-N-acetylglucosamine pyrophosphorylase/glucosamine-1-phosphate N-acetyltransferase
MGLSVIILAAGEGIRMRSSLPKVLHLLAGAPLLKHVLDTATGLKPNRVCIVYGHRGGEVRERFNDAPVTWVHQPTQQGTGHAVAQALPHVPASDQVLVLYGDVPLIRASTLESLVAAAGSDGLSLLTAACDDPSGYGRILRNPLGRVVGIVEECDATETERRLREVNTGFLVAPAKRLANWLVCVDNANAKGEFYLTDVIRLAVVEGFTVEVVHPASPREVMGVNDRAQLAAAEREFQKREAERLMCSGVTLIDPARLEVRGRVETGIDVVLDVGVVLEGEVRLGSRVRIGPYCILRDVTVADDAEVLPHCVIEGAVIGVGCRVGPFSRVRPHTRLEAGARLGNFVEVKQTEVGAFSKINHLSYVGDTEIGTRVNIGAGTITCNYDGANKHRTIIRDEAFIGSDTQLIAPVTVGAGATIGAGSTITRDAPEGQLTLSRAPQVSRPDWKRPVKATKREP